MNQVFYSTKCLSTQQPALAITYTVPAGRYISTSSVADANSMAQKDIDNNGQCYANNNGGCTINTTTYYNAVLSTDFTRNNCPSGQVGSVVTYTVPANKFTSIVSQADADAQAFANTNTYGQLYANTHGTCSPAQVYYNVVASANFTRNNCPKGQVGSVVTYTVAANTYSSIISQADADAQAQADINANGQAYANNPANGGICSQVYYNVVTSRAFQKQCKVGLTGTFVTYTVPAARYSSIISQADADAQAQADVAANGQAYANNPANGGICY
jgi:hypothetical protein